MSPAYEKKAPNTLIRKSNFTRLKKMCLQACLPQLVHGVTFLEAAGILISRGELRTFIELCFLTLRYGQDYLRRRHLQPGYFHRWLQKFEGHYSPATARQIEQLYYKPKISIIITENEGDLAWLRPCLNSVSNQWYPHWELYLISQGVAREQIENEIKKYPLGKDAKIFSISSDYLNLQNQGNEVLDTITGEFVVFPAGRDLLAPVALFEVVKLLNRHPEADIIYADEDFIDAAGTRSAPFFKPDWSPDLALSMPYTGRFTVYRTSLVQVLGGAWAELLPAALYDLLLRVMERTTPEKIRHIPKILYHRRLPPPKIGQDQEDLAEVASRQALQGYLQRTSQAGKVITGKYPGTYRLIRELQETDGVSIIIPFKDNLALLQQCLASIFQKTDYPLFELILVNNQSQEKATYAYLDSLAANPQVRLLDFPQPFNYAAMNNRAVDYAGYQYILFLNNDTEVISAGWLRAMIEHIQRDEVGAVGAKLIYPDHTIQHGGLAVGGGGLLCGDFFRGTPEDGTAHILTQVIRNCSAVTGACLLTKKHLFQAVGGFDEVNLPICYNDVDLCLKLRDQGYLVVWTPYARLYHYESASRGHTPRLAELERLCREQKYFEEKWWPVLEQDPYYNPNLSRLFDGYAY